VPDECLEPSKPSQAELGYWVSIWSGHWSIALTPFCPFKYSDYFPCDELSCQLRQTNNVNILKFLTVI